MSLKKYKRSILTICLLQTKTTLITFSKFLTFVCLPPLNNACDEGEDYLTVETYILGEI